MIVVFTDLDGTLLDENYSYKDAKPALDFLLRSNIPIVFCSSKTRAEIEVYREEIGIKDPFIVENGAAIFIPQGYFNFSYAYTRRSEKYDIIALGTKYSVLREKLGKIKERSRCKIIGFGDMTADEIAKDCGLDLKSAELAKNRDYDEAFRIVEGNEKEVLRLIKEKGLNCTKGERYYHIMGDNDKGKAVRILVDLYLKEYSGVKTMGLGDSLNDLPMLEAVDIPVLVQKANGKHDADIRMENIIKVDGIGSIGWKKAIEEIIW